MSTNFKNQMKEVMSLAWSFVKRNGFSMSETLKVAWANMKLKLQMKSGKSSVSCPLKPSDSAPLKHSTMPP